MSSSSTTEATGGVRTVTALPSPRRGDELVVCIAVLLIVLLTLAAIGLVILLYCAVKKRHLQQSRKYHPLPSKESIDTLNKAFGGESGSNNERRLPFPPRLDTGGIQPFTIAPQITSHHSEITSDRFKARYPFIQPATIPVAPEAAEREQQARPQKLKTKRKANHHKHARGRVIIRRGETMDSENSAGATTEADSRDASPHPSPQRTGSPAAYLLPAPQTSTASPNSSKIPEIFLTVRYNITISSDMIIKVLRVDSLPCRDDGTEVDAYVRLYFTPVNYARRSPRRTSKTHTERRSSAPVFEEEIKYANMSEEELNETTLHVEVLDYKSFGKHLLLGKADQALKELDLTTGQVNISLPLTPPEVQECRGTILLSMCFDPENRKLSLIILRAKDLNNNRKETDPVAKITVELKNRILSKLKTKKKSNSCSPIFNEAISCTVGMENIKEVKITVMLYNEHKHGRTREMGTIVLSSEATGDQLRHWNDVILAPGKHIAEWHDLH